MNRPLFGSQTKSNILNKSERSEIGVVWKRVAKNNREFLSIKLSKAKLQKLLEENDESINLIAFTNNTTNDRQPNFRIYEENK